VGEVLLAAVAADEARAVGANGQRSPLQREFLHGVEVGEVGVFVLQQRGEDVHGAGLLRRGDKLRDLGQGEAAHQVHDGEVVFANAVP